METWPIHEAKARFCELVKRAQHTPQQLTSHGQPVAVVLSAEAYQRQQHTGESLLEFLQRSPLAAADDLVLERNRSSPRDVALQGVAAGWLVDTNVISELCRRSLDTNVQAWLSKRPAAELFISVLTLGEIRKGVEALADSGRRTVLLEWLERERPVFFAERVLPIDAGVAHQWGQLLAEAGRSLPAIDSLLAATPLHHNLVIVSRNLKDVAGLPVNVLNPWEAEQP